MKLKSFVTMGVFSGFLSFAGQAFAADSLEFGARNDDGVAEVQVYVDRDEPAMRCLNCVRFNVLVADRNGRAGATYINQVLLKIRDTKVRRHEMFLRLPRLANLNGFSALWRHMTSPAKSEQYAISLPGEVSVADLSFELTATRDMAVRPERSSESLIAVEGTFTGRDVLSLNAVSARSIAGGRQR